MWSPDPSKDSLLRKLRSGAISERRAWMITANIDKLAEIGLVDVFYDRDSWVHISLSVEGKKYLDALDGKEP